MPEPSRANLQQDPAVRQQTVDAVAMSIAMRQVYGSQLAGQGFDLSKIPADIIADANKKVPDIVAQINAVGKDNFMAAGMKAVGQAGAVADVYRGSGAQPPAEVATFGDMISQGGSDVQKAVEAGKQDLMNSAAMDGSAGAIGKALSDGAVSTFPYVPVLATVAGTTIIGIILWKVL